MIARIESVAVDLEHKRKIQWLLLAGVTTLALLLRFFRLGTWSFWIDEIYTIGRIQAHYSTLDTALQNMPPHTNWIPVSLLFTAGFLKTLGISEWTARLGPALIGVLSIPILYIPIKRLFNARIALIAALLLAISPWHLYWSQNARFYTALMLFYTLALLAIYYGLERDRAIYIALGLLFFYLAASERILALFLVPVIGAYIILLWIFPFAKPPGFNRNNLVVLSLPVLAGILIEGLSLLTAGGSRFFADFGGFVGNPIDSPVRILLLIFFSIGLPVVVIMPFSGAWFIRQRSRAGLLMFVAATVPILILIGVSPFVFTVDRYALITLPAWLILAGAAIDRLATWLPRHGLWLAVAVVGIFVVDAAGGHLMYYELNEGNRPDWRGAFRYVEHAKSAGDLIVSTRPEIGQYYLDAENEIQNLENIDPTALENGDRRVWFVTDSEAVWYASPQQREWMEKNAELLFVWYLRTREKLDVKVYRYDPHR